MHKNTFDKLTYYAKVTLFLIGACKSLKILKNKYAIFGDFDKDLGQKTYEWILSALNKTFCWLEIQNIHGKYFEENIHEISVDYMGYYHEKYQFKEYHALNCCYHTIAFSCLAMIEYDKQQGLCDIHYFPSSLQEYPKRIDECLLSAQQASDNPQLEKEWQEKVIARLLQDHYTDNPEEFGKPIAREYIEELLGEKLPF